MDIRPLLELMVRRGASDLFFSVGRPPCIKLNNELHPVGSSNLSAAQTLAIVKSMLPPDRHERFYREREANFAHFEEGVARFRVSAFYQKDTPSIVMRHIETKIPTVEELELPDILKEIIMIQRGLVLCVGATGTGKSTTQAAMIGHRNSYSAGHILTVEDPIEYIHEHDKSIVNQREVGIDTETFETALKNSLRQAPDVILIGEVRSRETMQHAITFAETGHLCMATLHSNNANQALDRIINFFPEDRRNQLLLDLSLNLKAIIGQQLIPRCDGKERMVPAIELLLNTPYVADLIRRGEIHEIKDTMKRSTEHGMVTFDQALAKLHLDGKIGYEDALRYADSSNEVRLMIKLSGNSEGFEDGKFQISEDEDTKNMMGYN
jgi:twitching motility protein PilU